MLLFYIIFGDHNPPYPTGSNIPSARRLGQRFHFLQCRGSSPSLLFVNRHGGTLRRAGWVSFHQNIFTRKVTDIAFTCDFCNNHSHPASPASLYLTSPRPHVPYLMSQVPRLTSPSPKSPHTRPDVPVPLSPSHFYTLPHFPFARVFFSRRGLSLGEFPLPRTCLLGYCSVYLPP